MGFLAAFVVVRGLMPEHGVPSGFVEREVGAVPGVEARAAELVTVEERSNDVAATLSDPGPPAAISSVATATTLEAGGGLVSVLLHGTVASPDGDPLEGAFLMVEMPTGDRVTARSDELGRYALGPLPTGQWVISAYVRNHHTQRIDVDLPGTLEMERLDWVLRPQQVVRVRIATSAGEPAIPALQAAGHAPSRLNLVPVATREDPGTTFTGVTGSLNNTFGIGSFGQPGFIGPDKKYADEYGAVTLHQDGSAWISLVASHQVLSKQRVRPGDEVISFTLDPEDLDAFRSAVRATVLDAATGAPLEAAAFLGDDPFYNRESRFTTDASTGALVIEGALPGRRWLIVDSDGRASVKREVEVPRGGTLELGEIVMHEPVSIAGSVVGPDGEPLEAIVQWGVLDELSGEVRWASRTRTQSRPDGTFRIPPLEPAVYVVWSPGLPARSPRPHDASKASLAARVDARSQSVEGVELTLLPTTRITLLSGETQAPHPRVRALDAAGLPARSAWLGRSGPETHLDLPPGTYTLEVTRDGGDLLRRTVEVGGDPQRIELEIGPDGE